MINLNIIQKATPVLLVTLGGSLTLLLVISLLWNRTKFSLISIQPQAQQLIASTQSIELVFNQDAEKCEIGGSANIEKELIAQKEKNVIQIYPQTVWPKEEISIQIACKNFNTSLTYQVKPLEIMTEAEQAAEQTKLDYEFASNLESHQQQYPFADQFPIDRTDYRLMFISGQNAIVISPDETLTQPQKQAIITKERELLAPLNIPDEIPFVFSDEF